MCHSELRTARWEARHALGARQDQATARERKKKETFLCIHEYNFSERWGEEQRARKLMTFPYLQVCCRVFRRPLVARLKTVKASSRGRSAKDKSFLQLACLYRLCSCYGISERLLSGLCSNNYTAVCSRQAFWQGVLRALKNSVNSF